MHLTVQVKLLPTAEQADGLRHTLEMGNAACDRLSQLAWEVKEFRCFPLQKRFYRQIRDEFPALSAQAVIRLIAKVTDAYKLDRKAQRTFRPLGAISYDARILALKLPLSTVSIWTIGGRQKMPFVCGPKQRALLAYPHGESDLVFSSGKWFLNVTVEIPEEDEPDATDVLGVDLGIVQIAYDSDGALYSGSQVNKVRNRNRRLRKKLQRKGTKSAKRLLKKRAKREQRFARCINHTISKRIVLSAKRTNRAVALEDLNGIRARVRARKPERATLHSWSFAQLGGFIAYKARRAGVPLILVDPRYTSQRCSQCGHTEKANRKSQSEFACKACGHTQHADGNGAENIRLKGLEVLGAGALNRPHAEAIIPGQIRERTHLQFPTQLYLALFG